MTLTVLTAQGETPVAPIGHNAPADPFTLISESIEDLLIEANNFLDGKGIETDEQEAAVASILTRLRREKTAADDQRAAEKRPHDDAAKLVQEKWKPLIGRAETAIETARDAITERLRKKDQELRAAAEAAQQEAEEKAAAARNALAEAGTNLSARADAETLLKDAQDADRGAAAASKARPQAMGGERAVGLRSVWTPALADPVAALKHYRKRRPEELKAWLLEQAESDVRSGVRSIPGFEITEQHKAV